MSVSNPSRAFASASAFALCAASFAALSFFRDLYLTLLTPGSEKDLT